MSADEERLADDAAVPVDAVPDIPEPLLGFRSWVWDRRHKLLTSVVSSGVRWPSAQDLKATCPHHPRTDKHHPPVKDCSCGIYAAYDIEAAAPYTGVGNCFGLVWGWGKQAIPAINGYRAEYARVAAILAVAREVSMEPRLLRRIAQLYGVPLLSPYSLEVGDYRPILRELPAGQYADLTGPAGTDWDAELRDLRDRRGGEHGG